VLLNITNDGWFAQSPAAEQQLANATLRAVENRRPLLRCGNTGVTAEVLPTGQVDRWLPPFQQGFAAREIRVPKHPRATFYTQHGDWLSHVAIAVSLAMLALVVVRRLRPGTGQRPADQPLSS
jgi:apolipoprotein N-acyltransferase